MSYALRLAADANRALLSLPLEVQEEVFDILDRIASEAPATVAAAGEGTSVSVRKEERLVYRTDVIACDVYLYHTIDPARRTVQLERLAAVIFEDC